MYPRKTRPVNASIGIWPQRKKAPSLTFVVVPVFLLSLLSLLVPQTGNSSLLTVTTDGFAERNIIVEQTLGLGNVSTARRQISFGQPVLWDMELVYQNQSHFATYETPPINLDSSAFNLSGGWVQWTTFYTAYDGLYTDVDLEIPLANQNVISIQPNFKYTVANNTLFVRVPAIYRFLTLNITGTEEQYINQSEFILRESLEQGAAVVGSPITWKKRVTLRPGLRKFQALLPVDATDIHIRALDTSSTHGGNSGTGVTFTPLMAPVTLNPQESQNPLLKQSSPRTPSFPSSNNTHSPHYIQRGLNVSEPLLQTSMPMLDPPIPGEQALLLELDTVAPTALDQGVELAGNGTSENETTLEIEFKTPPPQLEEQSLGGRRRLVSISSVFHYLNVTAYADVPESAPDAIRLYWMQNGTKNAFNVSLFEDTNQNGMIDRIMWAIPHLSTQQFVIEITKADHLDENRTFIQDIFGFVSAQDGNWSPQVNDTQFVRVTFEETLNASKDITLYARGSGNASILVYTKNATQHFASFPSISSEGWYRLNLTSLIGNETTFDLGIIGGSVEFDYIVDPSASPLGTLKIKAARCVAEDSSSKGAWDTACDGTYPAGCPSDLISCNDASSETHTADTDVYAGINISVYNSTILDCEYITNVSVCYEWWTSNANTGDCDISVGNLDNLSWSAVTTTCPGTGANPGLTCASVNSSMSWNCSNFFGPEKGPRAQIRSEADRSNSGAAITLTWDALYYNVTYTLDATPPRVALRSPANASVIYPAVAVSFNYTAFDQGLNNCTVFANFSGTYKANLSTSTVYSGGVGEIQVVLTNGTYLWNVGCYDIAGNFASNESNRTVTVSVVNPARTSVIRPQSCAGEDEVRPKGRFTGTCDGTYPAACPTDLVTCNDASSEVHAADTNEYAGIRLDVYNSSVRDCGEIINVSVCSEWWVSSNPGDCDLSVNNDPQYSWYEYSTTCPGTVANPGVTCVSVTSFEDWSCYNFFGPLGSRAQLKSESDRQGNGAAITHTWDVFYYNVTYTLDDTVPTVRLDAPTNASSVNYSLIDFDYTPKDNWLSNCTLYANFSGVFGANISSDTPISGATNTLTTTVQNGTYVWNVLCTDVPGHSSFNSSNYTLTVGWGVQTLNSSMLVKPQACAAEIIATKGSFASACDGTYPADCPSDLVSCDDDSQESHQADTDAYAGIRLTSYNTSVYNCESITDIQVCYEFWSTNQNDGDCDISVDNDGDASWTPIYTSCPGVGAQPGTYCISVFSAESDWTCSNFFGPSGTRAQVKSEADRANGGNAINMTWEQLSYTVSYIIDNRPPTLTLDDPANDTWKNTSLMTFTYTPTDLGLNNCSLWGNFTGTFKVNNTDITVVSDAQDSFSAILNNGTYVWNIGCYDLAGNFGTQINRTIHIDGVRPSVQLNYPSNNQNISSTLINFTWNVTDNLDQLLECNLTLDGTVNRSNVSSIATQPTNYTVHNLTNAIHRWNVTCQDTAENVNTSLTFPFTVDTIQPSVNLTYPQDIFNSTATNLSFNWTAFDNLAAGIYCNLTIQGVVNRSQIPSNNATKVNMSVIGFPDNNYYWNVTCQDSSGNTNTSLTRQFNIDTSAPTPSLDAPANDSWQQNKSVLFAYTPFDVTLKNCTLWGDFLGSWAPNETNTTVRSGIQDFMTMNLTNGTYSWNVGCYDYVGNFGSNRTNFTFRIDSIPPTINLTLPVNSTNTTATSMTFNWTLLDNLDSTLLCNVTLDGAVNVSSFPGANGTYTNTTIVGILDANHQWNVTCWDSANATNTSQTRTFLVDTKPPAINLTSPGNDSWLTNNVAPFRFNVTDAGIGVSNCSIYFEGLLNQTNQSINSSIIQSFTAQLPNTVSLIWNVTCSDFLGKTNSSQNRVIKVDTTFPSVFNASINQTSLSINQRICLNATVNDTFSGVSSVIIEVTKPLTGIVNVTLSNSSTTCSGGSVYGSTLLNDEEGTYNWSKIYATDVAGNTNLTYPEVSRNWTVGATVFINVSLLSPTSPLEINESEPSFNYSYLQECGVECRVDSADTCQGVHLYTQFYNGTWTTLTPTTLQLFSNATNQSCGTLNNGGAGSSCNQTFRVTSGQTSGGSYYPVRCFGSSSNAPVHNSSTFNLSINDHPVAAFSFPTNGSFLHRNETLNGSVSTDDQSLATYRFELDSDSAFGSSTILCSSSSANCTLNTLSQTQCAEDTFACYLRLNVSDSDGLVNFTTIQVMIDNSNPVVALLSPANAFWANTNAQIFTFNATDANLQACVLYHNASGSFQANVSNASVATGRPTNISTSFPNGNFIWNVYCNDSAKNAAFNGTNLTFSVDTVFPTIEYAGGTENDSLYVSRDYVFVNISAFDLNEANITFFLFNTTSLLNASVFTDGRRTVNFTSVNPNAEYYYNVTISDFANNLNSTATRRLTLDSSPSSIDFAGGTSANNSFVSRDWIFVNISTTEQNIRNLTFSLYNASRNLVNETTLGPGNTSFNFTFLVNPNSAYYYNVSLNDQVGFVITTSTRIITLDARSPTVNLSQPLNGLLTSLDTFQFNFTPYDTNLANCSLYLNFTGTFASNQTISPPTTSIKNSFSPITFADDGIVLWNVLCIDKAENEAFNSTNFTLNIDTTPPTAFTLTTPPNNTQSRNQTPIFTWTATDDQNFKNYTIIVDTNISFPSPDFNFSVVGNVSNTSVGMTSNLTMNQIYYWKVLAYDLLGQNRNTSAFLYITDNITPVVSQVSPAGGTTVTTSTFLIDFKYNVTDVNDIGNCSLILNGNIDVNDIQSNPSRNITMTISKTMDNGYYNWSIRCFDLAGNQNTTINRNLTINVSIPIFTYFETFGFNSTISPNLNITEDGQENANTLSCTQNAATPLVNSLTSSGVGNNGFLMKANQTINFSGDFSLATSVKYVTWTLNYYNGSQYIRIARDGNLSTGGRAFAAGGRNVNSSTRNQSLSSDTYLRSSDKFHLNASLYYNAGAAGQQCVHYWDNSNSFFKIFGYPLGFVAVNLTYPTTDPQPLQGANFNVSCTVNCTQGFCIGTQVSLELYNASGWNQVDSNGNIVLGVAQNNPTTIGTINNTAQEVNFSLKGNLFSRDNPLRCNANSTYGAATPGYNLTVTVRDIFTPSVVLGSPANNSYDSDGSISFSFTPHDNDNVSYCALILSGVTNKTSTPMINDASNSISQSGLNDTTHSWVINCTDSFSNYNISDIWYITVDSIEPSIAFAGGTAPNNTGFSRNWIFVNVSVTEIHEANITFYLYNSSFALINATTMGAGNRSFNFTGLLDLDETYFYNVTSTDLADNQNSTETRVIILDNVTPVVNLLSPLNNTWIGQSAVSFVSYGVDASLSACTVYHNASGTFAANVTNSSLSSSQIWNATVTIPDGSYIWNTFCNDSAGNGAFNHTNLTVKVDATYPTIAFSSGTAANNTFYNNASQRTYIYVNVTVTEINEANISFTLSNSSGVTNVTNRTAGVRGVNFTDLNSNAVYQYSVTVRDFASLASTTETRVLTIDFSPPNLTMHNATPNSSVQGSLVTIYANITDNIQMSSVQVLINGSNRTMSLSGGFFTHSFNTSSLSGGTHSYTLFANDTANNRIGPDVGAFSVNATDNADLNLTRITFSNATAVEGQNISVYVNVSNIGGTAVLNTTISLNISLWNGTYLLNESLSTVIFDINPGSVVQGNFSWLVRGGTWNFLAHVDPLNNVTESLETNNQLQVNYTTSTWQVFYGTYLSYLIVLAGESATTLQRWNISNLTGNSFYSDYDASYLPPNLLPLNTSGDFAEADASMQMAYFNDSLSRFFDANGDNIADTFTNFTISSGSFLVPTINSTNSSNFITGVMWDSADGGLQYNGTQDIVFVTKINLQQLGRYGTYDYEVRVPINIKRVKAPIDSVTRMDELI